VQDNGVRLFVALDVPEAVRAALAELSDRLKKTCQSARWVRLEGVHITLKFIGEVPPDKVQTIRQALGEVLGFAPIQLRFAGLGFFPSARRPRVFWAGVEDSSQLAEIAAAIEARLVPFGIPTEKRAFHAHLTLARFESPQGTQALAAAVEALGAPEFGSAIFNEFYLYQSVLKRSGAEYTRLVTYPFRRETAP
jgi:RNA 2',3'-cyclic 3'-phosphodiesterase